MPVSGVYLVYGQVYFAGSTSSFTASAGISISGGTTQWGTLFRWNGGGTARSLCATVRRHMRLVAGQTIALECFQFVGASMNTINSAPNQQSKMIAVWRSF